MHIVKGGAVDAMFMRPANLDIMSGDTAVIGNVLRGEHAHFSWLAAQPITRLKGCVFRVST